jgi:arylsulfate sulfotransferase
MWFRSVLDSLKSRPSVARVRQPSRRRTCRLRLEVLEDRNLLSGIVTLAPNEAAPQLVGDAITWTASAMEVGAAPVYQFSAAPHGDGFHVVRDFSPTNSFAWTPMHEGSYDIEVAVKDGYQATDMATAVAVDAVASRVTGSQPVVTATSNPLVTLYSAPPSSAGTIFVQFAVASDDPAWRDTDTRSVVPGKSTNFFVAGMLPDTTYEMRDVRSDATGSAPLFFTTGSLPSNLAFPSFTVPQPPGAGSDLDQDMIVQQPVGAPKNSPALFATDLTGHVTWYDNPSQADFDPNLPGNVATLMPGGTVLLIGGDSHRPFPTSMNVLRETDLASNPLRETNLDAVNAQLTAMGHEMIYSFTHDVQRLPNGQTVVVGLAERTVNIHGTPTDYIGDMIVVLDQSFQVTWAWDAFDYLDVNRGPTLGELVQPGVVGPASAVPTLPAVDWLHVNAVSWSPGDGNLILSIRHQDWVIKIDYRNGVGDGHVVWRLGAGGDFAVNSTDPNPWFSHQHDAHYIDDHTLILFDNGNIRQASDPNAHSRGQVWVLDETKMTATLVVNADLGAYSGALGAAQRLSNGNYSFTLGTNGPVPPPPKAPAHAIEVSPNGAEVYDLTANSPEYRTFRVRTLYEGVDDALAGAPQKVESIVLNDGGVQRSMVNSVTVSFNGAVVLDPGAIELHRQDGSLVGLHADISILGGKTVAVLTFVGKEFVGGSLADGSYALTVRADRVHDRWGRELDGDGNGSAGGDRVDGFTRLFGDGNGDGKVDVRDLFRFLQAFGSHKGDLDYQWYFDYDGNGVVGVVDFIQFVQRLGKQ